MILKLKDHLIDFVNVSWIKKGQNIMQKKYKILIIDDEQSILDMLKLQFQLENYIVYTAVHAKEALEKLSNCQDIILLDIYLEDKNGFDLCASIREFVSCPILFLTARVSEQDKINGFLVGGDDYITKPFSIHELLARVCAHLRREERIHTKTKGKFLEEVVIDYSNKSIYIKGNRIYVSNIEFEIIQLLSRYAGHVFDRE